MGKRDEIADPSSQDGRGRHAHHTAPESRARKWQPLLPPPTERGHYGHTIWKSPRNPSTEHYFLSTQTPLNPMPSEHVRLT